MFGVKELDAKAANALSNAEEGTAMPEFFVYAGLAGDTDPGRYWSAGLYRSGDGRGTWESLGKNGFDAEPHVFAILPDPSRPGRVTVGTSDGIWRSDDHGSSWRRLDAPRPQLAIWSLALHPDNPDVMIAGYEPCAIYRSEDDGRTWRKLDGDVAFPAISLHHDLPKRPLSIAFDRTNPREIYVSLEIGGLLRSLDGGSSWSNTIDGLYVDEGSVDIHSVVTSASHSGRVTVATRYGTFRSDDRAVHWRNLQAPKLRPIGSYCRVLAYAPSDANTLYLAAANDFDGDLGAVFVSRDDGGTWERAELGVPIKTPMFGLAVATKLPDHVFCSTKIGQVGTSADRGRTWRFNPLPHAAGHVFAFAAG
jgi:photosystem II stability/assembly factor-like uncharacterized protein